MLGHLLLRLAHMLPHMDRQLLRLRRMVNSHQSMGTISMLNSLQ
jgi:hypothetical protein